MSICLSVKNLSMSYDGQQVLSGLSFELADNEISCLVGPSGSGKSSLLRCVAGFEGIDAGSIELFGKTISTVQKTLPPHRRQIGIVFQDFALFPHLNVEENIAFGLPKRSESRVREMLELVQLLSLAQKYPYQLSGGEQQRVALARALAPEPKLVLLDEPFSQLDPELRVSLAAEMRQIFQKVGTTVLIVTHSQNEAFDLGDNIGVLHQGRLLQWSSAYEVYHKPQHPFVADFIGRGSFLKGRVTKPKCIQLPVGEACGETPLGIKVGDLVDVLIRPDDVQYDPEGLVRVKVLSRSFRGPYFLYRLQSPCGKSFLSLIPSHHQFENSEEIGIRLNMDHIICFRNSVA